MSGYQNNSIFWVETSKIQPNPYQPRRDFEPNALEDLADSIRQYGVLQPLVVTRTESYRDDGGMDVSYELIAGERRLRASKLAGLQQVPVIIRKETDNKVRLELAIIENLQREDLNPIDRALAFEQLYKEFNLTHAEIGKRMGKSRVYVSNSLRLLSLPDEIKQALTSRKITEGHTRPLLMLIDRPQEQNTLFREILVKNMSVRDAEKIARKVAQDKVRKKEYEIDPKISLYEKRLSENLGTRVQIEAKEKGGKIVIDYFTLKDLDTILSSIKKSEQKDANRMMDSFMQKVSEQGETSSVQKNDLSESTALEFLESKTQEAPVEENSFITGNPYKQEENEIPAQHVILERPPESTPVEPEVAQTHYQQAEDPVPYVVPDPVVQQPVASQVPQEPQYQEQVPSYQQPPVQQQVIYQQAPRKRKGFFGRIFG